MSLTGSRSIPEIYPHGSPRLSEIRTVGAEASAQYVITPPSVDVVVIGPAENTIVA